MEARAYFSVRTLQFKRAEGEIPALLPGEPCVRFNPLEFWLGTNDEPVNLIADFSKIKSATKPIEREDGSPLQQGDEWYEFTTGIDWYWESTLSRWLSKQFFTTNISEARLNTDSYFGIGDLEPDYNYLIQKVLISATGIYNNNSNYLLTRIKALNPVSDVVLTDWEKLLSQNLMGGGGQIKTTYNLLYLTQDIDLQLAIEFDEVGSVSLERFLVSSFWRLAYK